MSCKHKPKESRNGYIISRQSRLQSKNAIREKDIIKRINPSERQSNPKCVCTKQQSCEHMNQTLTGLKMEIQKSTLRAGNLSILLSTTEQLIRKPGRIQKNSTPPGAHEIPSTFIEYPTQQQNTHVFQGLTEHTPR